MLTSFLNAASKSLKTLEVGSINIPILEMGKLRLRELGNFPIGDPGLCTKVIWP